MMGEPLLEYKSVQNWFDSLDKSAQTRGKNGLTENAKKMRLSVFWKFTDNGKLNPDELLEEAKKDIKNVAQRIKDYFDSSMNRGLSNNSASTHVAYIRGFFTHNDVVFPKRYGMPKTTVSEVSKKDAKTQIYDYNEENGKIVFNNGKIQHFIQNLNFRNQTIALSLLSTGADASDILKLNIEFVKDGKGKISKVKRLFWHGNRGKNAKEFKVFFSEEATEFLKRYVEQERADAEDSEPLFVKEKGLRMDAHSLAMQFRDATQKMGYKIKGHASPFRPKRFRHLFRTACGVAEIDNGFIMAFMGHASNVSASYLEKNRGLFLKEYVRIEPYLTVFGVNKNKVTEMSEEIEDLKGEVDVLAKAGKIVTDKTGELEQKVQDLQNELAEEKAKIASIYSFVTKNLDPLMDFVNDLAEYPEFEELKKKMMESKFLKNIDQSKQRE